MSSMTLAFISTAAYQAPTPSSTIGARSATVPGRTVVIWEIDAVALYLFATGALFHTARLAVVVCVAATSVALARMTGCWGCPLG